MPDNFEELGFKKDGLILDSKKYNLYKRRWIFLSPDAPCLIVISYLPNKSTIDILKICLETIKKFTDSPYELWVIDNNSPLENIRWLENEPGINLVLNRTLPKKDGSYANAIGLEIGIREIDQDSKYVMTLHQDIMVCKKGWLKFLQSKFNKKIRAVGVRLDNQRVKEGVLHVLGYVFDFQLFKKLKINFYPHLPEYDVGDNVSIAFKKAGYKIYGAKNTNRNNAVVRIIPKRSPFSEIFVDRSLNDNNEVFLMHLGRGVLKSVGQYQDRSESLEKWKQFASKYLLAKESIEEEPYQKVITELWYSVRRCYVDDFFMKNISIFKKGANILDIGGKKTNKRGLFNIEKYNLKVKYANIDRKTKPDFLCDASKIPVKNNTYEGVVLSEVLEHIYKPEAVLKEAKRILKNGGKILICTPFNLHIHADPDDYLRITDAWYQKKLTELGFINIEITKQGLFFAVLANMMKGWACESNEENHLKQRLLKKFSFWLTKKSFKWDERIKNPESILSKYSTGFGIICEKKE